MARFVLLRHECPPEFKASHWDLMLEVDGVLATWELASLPAVWAERLQFERQSCESPVPARRLPDHRLAYLDYEGPVSGNRGSVRRVASGCFEQEVFDEDNVIATLLCDTLPGKLLLSRDADSDRWELTLH